jgi:hypothetical protein
MTSALCMPNLSRQKGRRDVEEELCKGRILQAVPLCGELRGRHVAGMPINRRRQETTSIQMLGQHTQTAVEKDERTLAGSRSTAIVNGLVRVNGQTMVSIL